VLSKDNRYLQDRLARGQGEISSREAKLLRSRDSHEAHLSKQEGQVRALEEQLKANKADKTFLEQAFSRLEDSNSRLEGELKLEREKNLMGERRLLELRQALSAQEERASKAREEAAFQAGALEELRRQGASYRERLVGAKEATDADIAGLRQEMKASAEEIKILLRTIRSERSLREQP
jgi:predicted  nucleic acid-binding Zn-ribbon protein